MLDASPLNPSAPEAQGMLYGFLCGGGRDPITSWLDQIMPLDGTPQGGQRDARSALQDYAAPIADALGESDAGVHISQPDDSAPLAERAIAVYDWVRGFLYAMGALKISEQDLSAEGAEAYRDLASLTRMDLDALDDSEENEQALTEVTEFVRVSALLIREERTGRGRQGLAS